MNLPQRIVLGIGLLAVLAIVLFPPWIIVYHYDPPFRLQHYGEHGQQKMERPGGYHAIWADNTPQDPTALGKLFSVSITKEPERLDLQYFSTRLDKDRLWIQLAGAVIVTAILCILLKSRNVQH